MEMWMDHTGIDERGIHRARARPSSGGDSTASIDLTPMLDVVMIMLIFFIVTGSFVREVAIELDRKQTSNVQSNEPSDTITVQVSATDEIWIKGRRVDARSVRANISQLRAANPKAGVVIKAHNKSTVDTIASIADSARQAGVYQVGLSTGE